MKYILAAAFIAGAGLFGASHVQALPLAPMVGDGGLITTIAQGCGRGNHRGRDGYCRPDRDNFRRMRPAYGAPVCGAPVYGAPVYGAPLYGGPVLVRPARACPAGYDLTPRGNCRPRY